MYERYLASSSVARRLGVSPKTVSRWAKDGRLPYFTTLGGHRRFKKEAIERLAADLGHPVELIGTQDSQITRWMNSRGL